MIAALLIILPSALAVPLSAEKFQRGGGPEKEAATPHAVGDSWTTFLGSAGIPVSFARLELRDDAEATLGSTLALGASYTFILGNATKISNDEIELTPGFFFGGAINTGLSEATDLSVEPSLSIAGIVGIDTVAITAGRDFLSKETFIGLSAKVDVFRLKKTAFNCIAGCDRD